MPQPSDSSYFGREQSQIKHEILRKYLERFAIIVGKHVHTIVYVDGFSGPWNVQSDDFKDASFFIALDQLRQARDVVRQVHKREFNIKCIFLEKEPGPFEHLARFAKSQTDADVIAVNRDFEQAVPELVTMLRGLGRGAFPFIFIDPRGWKGFSMDLIRPLIQIRPCEVLINFMTSFILRFIEDERLGLGESFRRLFGNDEFKMKLPGLQGRDREDAIVFHYAKRIREVGGFEHAPVTIVQHPIRDRTHFHLVYATRNVKGLEVFKEVEKRALDLAGELRADAKRREREMKSGQAEFFTGSDSPETNYTKELSRHYAAMARDHVHRLIRREVELPYDRVYSEGMKYPLVHISMLRDWIQEIADYVNLSARQRFPQLRSDHRVRLRQLQNSDGLLNL